jgi:hypothetical protein
MNYQPNQPAGLKRLPGEWYKSIMPKWVCYMIQYRRGGVPSMPLLPHGCFIDPYRVRKPQDKGKVERDVQTIRQQFRKFKALYATLDIAFANRLITHWVKHEYGQRDHGTTGEKPYPLFSKDMKDSSVVY